MNIEYNTKKYVRIKRNNDFGILKSEIKPGVYSVLSLSGELIYLAELDFEIVDFSEIISRLKMTSEKLDFATLDRLSGSCDNCRALVNLISQILNGTIS